MIGPEARPRPRARRLLALFGCSRFGSTSLARHCPLGGGRAGLRRRSCGRPGPSRRGVLGGRTGLAPFCFGVRPPARRPRGGRGWAVCGRRPLAGPARSKWHRPLRGGGAPHSHGDDAAQPGHLGRLPDPHPRVHGAEQGRRRSTAAIRLHPSFQRRFVAAPGFQPDEPYSPRASPLVRGSFLPGNGPSRSSSHNRDRCRRRFGLPPLVCVPRRRSAARSRNPY